MNMNLGPLLMKKRIVFTILLVISLVLFSSYGLFDKDKRLKPNLNGELNQSEYLSITCTKYNDGNGPENGMTTLFIKYDIQGKKLTEIMGVDYSSQYPLGIISMKDQKVYYTAEGETKAGSDQLYSYDLVTKESQQLTEDLFAINYILPRENDVVLVGVKRGTSAIRLIQYDKKTGKVIYNNLKDDDTCVEYASLLLNHSNDLYAATYSDNARRASSQAQASGNADHYIIPDYTILKYGTDFSKPELITTVNNRIVRSVSGNGHYLVTKEVDHLEHDTYKLFIQDLSGNEKPQLNIEGVAKFKDLQIDCEGRKIYFVGILDHSTERGIFCYDMERKTLEKIFAPEEGKVFINNFTLISE